MPYDCHNAHITDSLACQGSGPRDYIYTYSKASPSSARSHAIIIGSNIDEFEIQKPLGL